MPLGNSDAVRKGNEREAHPSKPGPARETAEKRTAATPERTPEKPAEKPAEAPRPREKTRDEERAEDLRRAIPGITEAAIATLLKQIK